VNVDLLLALFGSRPKVLQTVTFSANATWPCPSDVNLLNSVVGHGVNGTAGSADIITPGAKRLFIDQFLIAKPGYSDYHAHEEGTWSGDVKPENTYERTYIGDWSNAYDYNDVYHSYTQSPDTVTPGSPGSTGATATGFGKIFPGGDPDTPTAATTSYPNTASPNPVTVTPSSSYTVVVPPGAVVQITYYQ